VFNPVFFVGITELSHIDQDCTEEHTVIVVIRGFIPSLIAGGTWEEKT
jgi:hypothetical protein